MIDKELQEDRYNKKKDRLDGVYYDKKFADIFDKDKFSNSFSVLQAIDQDDAENVMDFTEFGKNTITVDRDPDRFKCQLSEYSLI